MNPHALVFRLLFALLATALLATSARAVSPKPPFLIGTIAANPSPNGTGKPTLVWDISVPPGAGNHSHFIKQISFNNPVPVEYSHTNLAASGQTVAPLSVFPGGARFELWSVSQSPNLSHLLASIYISPFGPVANVAIRSEDPYPFIARTRADRPFQVDVNVQGVVSDPSYPPVSRSVDLLRHSQSYGPAGTGANLDRNMATLVSTASITTNGLQTLTYATSVIPSADPAKVRGEETFSIWTVVDDSVSGTIHPPEKLAARSVQVWPVADGTITGIGSPIVLGSSVPEITITLNDLYPKSTTWTRVYKGQPPPGATGTTLPGTTITLDDAVPHNRVITTNNYASLLTSNGLWTVETMTETPFGIDRIATVTFTVQSPGTALEQWRQTHFGTTANAGDAADLHDFDDDGIPNLIEFAFALHPRQDSSGTLPTPQLSGENQVITFTPPTGVEGITYGAQWSATLAEDSWTDIPNNSIPPQHTFVVPAPEPGNVFLRLKVTGQ